VFSAKKPPISVSDFHALCHCRQAPAAANCMPPPLRFKQSIGDADKRVFRRTGRTGFDLPLTG
jgi:hypothetical protein